VAIKLVSTAHASTAAGVKALVYGGAGYGKTYLSSTAPSPVILSAEAGLLSLRGFNIPSIRITNFADLVEAHAWVMKSAEARQFGTIVLDSVSEIAEVVLADALEKAGKDPRRAYGELSNRVGELMRDFRDIHGKHVYFAAKEQASRDQLTGAVTYGVSMPGQQLGQQIPYFFDLVFRLTIVKHNGTDYRVLRTRPDAQSVAKDRSGRLDELEPANLTHVFNKVLGA
jgi:hypothetical protein